MITTPLMMQQYEDQVLAALAEGPGTTEEICARLGFVICACPLCLGVPRPARPRETEHFLTKLVHDGRARSELVRLEGVPCPNCGTHDQMALRWEKANAVAPGN